MLDLMSGLSEGQEKLISLTTAVLTLIATIVTVWIAHSTRKIAVKSYTQIEREPPWKITPVRGKEKGLWLLERLHPIVTTIYGYCIVDFPANNGVYPTDKEIHFYDDGNRPLRWFVRNSNMVIQMSDVGVGASLNLIYREHRTPLQAVFRKSPRNSDYVGQVDSHYVFLLSGFQALGRKTISFKLEILLLKFLRKRDLRYVKALNELLKPHKKKRERSQKKNKEQKKLSFMYYVRDSIRQVANIEHEYELDDRIADLEFAKEWKLWSTSIY